MAKKRKSHSHKKGKKKSFRKQLLTIFVFVILVAVVAWLLTFVSGKGDERASTEVAAVVNGEEITTAYLESQYAQIPDVYKSALSRSDLLDQTITEMLMLQEAENKGISVTPGEINQEIASAMIESGISESDLEQRLNEQNMTREYVEDLYRKQLVINKLLEEKVFSKITIDDSDVKEFYDSRIHAMHILVDSEEEANSILAQLEGLSGKDLSAKFQELASTLSKDPSAETNGGDLGEFGKGMMVPAFEEAAFALDVGELSKPVQTQFGWHVILRVDKDMSLEDQSELIREQLVNQKKGEYVPKYIDWLKEKAEIEIFFEEPETEPAADLGLPQLTVEQPEE